jgi:hypothetical protein
MATASNPDLNRIIDLINRINFFKSSMEEHVLVAVIEQELAKHFEFQVTCNGNAKRLRTHWSYYIRCCIQYPEAPQLQHSSRIESLLLNLELLRDTALNKE